MGPPPLTKRIDLKAGDRLAILNAPQRYVNSITPLPPDVVVDRLLEGTYDQVHVYVATQNDVQDFLPAAYDALTPFGKLWVVYNWHGPRPDIGLADRSHWYLSDTQPYKDGGLKSLWGNWAGQLLYPRMG